MAYGARLESVLGASPHGFESHILRSEKPQSSLGFLFTFKCYILPCGKDLKKGLKMQNSGESEFSEENKTPKKLTLTFWQSFLLTLAGAAGLISMVADGPLWISVTGFTLVIALILWLLFSQGRKNKN